jgi:peptidoglycan/xylan/chitin deacetylase (PgdA/CDA1 family)
MSSRLHKLSARSLKSLAAPLWSPFHTTMRLVNGRNYHAGKVTILCYHRIVANITQVEQETLPGMVTSVETFRKQMELVCDHYEAVSLAEAVSVLRGERKDRGSVLAITFDDGYRDFYEQAWPILRELGLPATLFIPTAYIGSGRMLDHDRFYRYVMRARSRGLSLRVPLVKARLSEDKVEALCSEVDPLQAYIQFSRLPFAQRESSLSCLEDFVGDKKEEEHNGSCLLNWEMVREMASAGISFGAHTENHVVLTHEEPETVEREILRSKQVLEEMTGRPVRHFAYPTGRYNAAIMKAVASIGFEAAVTTERRLNRRGDELLRLGRICLCEESTRGMNGNYSEAVARLRLAV